MNGPPVWNAVVVAPAPTSPEDALIVSSRELDLGTTQLPVLGWRPHTHQSGAPLLPVEGDRVAIIFDATGVAWAVAWEPASRPADPGVSDTTRVAKSGDTMTGDLTREGDSGSARRIGVRQTGDSVARSSLGILNTDRGYLAFGDGTAFDWVLYRSAANVASLITGDDLRRPAGEDGTHDDSMVRKAQVIEKSLLTTRGDMIRRGASAPERVALGPSGSVMGSNGTDAAWVAPMACYLYNPDYAGATTISNAVERLLDWNSEAYDHGGWHAANATNIVCPSGEGGIYHFDAAVRFTTSPAGAYEGYVIVRQYNSAAALRKAWVQEFKGPAGTGVAVGASVSRDCDVADGDYFTLSVYQSSGGNLTMGTASDTSIFSLHRLFKV